MISSLGQFFEIERRRTLQDCVLCGICIESCPIIAETELATLDSRQIQRALLDFLDTGKTGEIVEDRLSSCMRCYGCVSVCPQGLNSLRTLEICSWKDSQQRPLARGAWDPKAPDLVHRVLAGMQTGIDEYRRIFRQSPPRQADTVFFPGCNVYYQPEKLLNAMEIMAIIDPGHAFVPGLDRCCGNCHLTRGRPDVAQNSFTELLETIRSFTPRTLVLWCPTCYCLHEKTFGAFTEYDFEILSLSQYLTKHLDKLEVDTELKNTAVTVHDACKVVHCGLDMVGTRRILEKSGAQIVEMARTVPKPACCGCSAIGNSPEAGNRMLARRCGEAAATGADVLVTACHYCNQMLAGYHGDVPFMVEHFINLLAGGYGIRREDTYRKYRQWADVERILADISGSAADVLFASELIEKTIREVFTVR